MAEACHVRDANESDSTAIASLLTELGYPRDAAFVSAKLRSFDATLTVRVLVAEYQHNVVGVLSFDSSPLFHQAGNIGTITSLSIAEAYQRKGVGQALVEAAEQIAREAGCIKIAVASGFHREGAHAFYRKMGYAENTKRFLKGL